MKNQSVPKGAQGKSRTYSSVFTLRIVNFTSHRKLLSTAAAALALSAVALPASATNWWNATPPQTIGSTVLDVRSFGASGNGSTDDTAAIQAAVDALPSSGGTIVVPDGTYMINATKGISLRSHTRLSLSSSTYLKAIPNSSDRYWVVKIWKADNVEIVGGHIIGERYQHRGTYGQWGYCVNVSGSSNVYLHNVSLSDSWGDGILVGGLGWGKDMVPSYKVTLNGVSATGNRRQGMSITPANQVYIVNSSFTSSKGNAPQAGVDIEPQTQGDVSQVRLENTTLSDNAGNGLEVHNRVNGVSLYKVTAENNKGFGVYTGDPTNITIQSSTLSQNWLFGVSISAYTSHVKIFDNTINYNGDAWFYAHGVSIFSKGWAPRDISIADTASYVTQYNNTVSPMK
ncbi:right-handed parallel beta-helix repeat-containing protein [Dyella acidisoli]|uniref:right-handed parallel beta-helix repeat-containing protein n=1 Tax=Dyella acidisoli TaxID=1867834 RepID=UPI0024E160F1|nr:right-handed parallel beta-helix repeat-containing protein [Dyella acidisoli]